MTDRTSTPFPSFPDINSAEGKHVFNSLPDLVNDEGASVNLGCYNPKNSHYKLYCKRYFGTHNIPHSDGYCGPDAGGQCSSCISLQSLPGTRVEILRRIYPSLRNEEGILYITRSLRHHHGCIRSFLNQTTLPLPIDYRIALSAAFTVTPYTRELNDIMTVLTELTNVSKCFAEFLLKKTDFDVNEAAQLLLDERDQEEIHFVNYSEAQKKNVDKSNSRRETQISEALRADFKADFAVDLGVSWTEYLPLTAAHTPPQMVITNGHRMVLIQNDEASVSCPACASKIPSNVGGSYYCQTCLLCEGCVHYIDHTTKKPISIFACPAVKNGGHLHHHPLKFNPDRHSLTCHCDTSLCGYKCDIKSDGCTNKPVVWSCSECDFNVCVSCANMPMPDSFNRRQNKRIEEDFFTSEDKVVDGFIPLFAGFFDSVPEEAVFDEEAAEREVAAIWESSSPAENDNSGIVLGTGAIRTDAHTIYTSTEEAQDRQGNSMSLTIPMDGDLPNEVEDALLKFRAKYDQAEAAAADVAHVENILRRIAQPISDECKSSYDTLLKAISADKLGIAGTLLLSHAYAPISSRTAKSLNSDNSQEEVTCWCGEAIDSDTAPDGVVGCLGGHAMHAACATDLLLGGGKCPTCRQTLFFSRVARSEVKAAAEFTKKEIQRSRLEEEEKIRDELEDLEKRGLEPALEIGDVVLVSSDTLFCKKAQLADPISGWWHKDMSAACGLEGRVLELIKHENKVVSVRVFSHRPHIFINIDGMDAYCCERCNRTCNIMRYCERCNLCEVCCRTLTFCQDEDYKYFWNPSTLTLLRRYGSSIICDNNTFAETEQHILRLRGELISIKAARENVKTRTEAISKLEMPQKIGRGLSSGSRSALSGMITSGITLPDWQRAHHYLLLAHLWGDSDTAKAKRATLYNAVREGNIDSVARIVRRHNAAKAVDDAKWADAMNNSFEYVVDKCTVVNLQAFPNVSAPRTGFTLDPATIFSSKQEMLDRNGNMWLEIAESNKEGPADNIEFPSPQGWVRIRPGGDGSASIVKKNNKNRLRCFRCGEGMISPVSIREQYVALNHEKIQEGDSLLVAATLESVKVKSIKGHRIYCSFLAAETKVDGDLENADQNEKDSMFNTPIWYRACDLVMPKVCKKTYDDSDETRLVNGRLRSRRELVLAAGGDGINARNLWNDATNMSEHKEHDFASCVRGHLLHARCLQDIMLAGSRCPAPGCMEQMFLPGVTPICGNDDTTCCGRQTNSAEIEALQAVSELAGHEALLKAQAVGLHNSPAQELRTLGDHELKMCPVCFAGPLFNEECSDMEAHHGHCAVMALREDHQEPCTPDGDFWASASEISARMTKVSNTKSVADLLPRCETHNVLVMFNGCMDCGHLFTDIDWDDIPTWDSSARDVLHIDKKRRNAIQLLTEQVRTQASMLQYERDALLEAGGLSEEKEVGWGGQGIETVIEPP